MRDNNEIIELIQNKLDTSPISMSELAKKANVSKSTLSRYLSRDREFPLNKANDFAKALNMSTDDFLGVRSIQFNEAPVNGGIGNLAENNGDITINNNEANPVPVTVNNLDDVFEVQEKANENHQELNTNQTMVLETMVKLVEVNKEILKELKRLNKKIK